MRAGRRGGEASRLSTRLFRFSAGIEAGGSSVRALRRAWKAGVAAALMFGIGAGSAQARGISLVRDAEIENSIRVWSAPIFDGAGLVPEDVRIHLVRDPRLNAFVAGGQRIFIHTGLLIRSEHAGQVIGVIAHEAGHISGGHLARLQEALRNATAQSIIGMVLAGAAGIASGRGDVAAAGMSAGTQMAQRTFLAYSRTQESAADQAAVQFLDYAGVSSRGLLEFFAILKAQERNYSAGGNPYLRTHPMSADRTSFVRSHVAKSRFSDAALPPEFAVQHLRMRAKLIGFLQKPNIVLNNSYPPENQSMESRYARTIALYRLGQLDQAVPMVDQLIAEHPEDPFFYELKGQMLFENGRTAEAVAPYEEAVRLFPWSGLLRMGLAQAMIESNDPELTPPAVAHLNEAVRYEPGASLPWRLLAIAYGRSGDRGNLTLALAEQALREGRVPDAIGQATRASDLLPYGSPGWLRAQDIVTLGQKPN